MVAAPPGPGPTPRERRIVWTVAMVQLINMLDFMMVMPLADDFAQSLDIDRSHIGYVSGAYTGAAFAAGLIGSRFLDRFDRRSALLVAMFGLAIGTALGGVATGLGTLIFARVIAGLFGGPATSLSLAIVADVVPVERRGRAMGVVMAGFSVSSVLGLPAGLALARLGSWRMPFFVIAGLAVVVALVASRILPSVRAHLDGPKRRYTPMRELLARREIQLGLLTGVLVMWSVFIIVPNIPTYLLRNLGFPRKHYELLYAAGGAAALVALQIGGRWIDRAGTLPVMTAGTAIAVTALASGFLVEPPAFPIPLVFILFMCSAPLRGAAQSTLATRLPAPNERAQYMSLQSAVQHAAMTAGAVVSSAILVADPTTSEIEPMWKIAAIAIGVAALAPIALAAAERALRRRNAMKQ
jgi:predicted MFS family arabinose efflux permease